jgi:hypothetical protein
MNKTTISVRHEYQKETLEQKDTINETKMQ